MGSPDDLKVAQSRDRRVKRKRSGGVVEEFAGEGGPLVIQGSVEGRAACLAVPVAGVAQVAFLAVQVGVDASAVRPADVIRELVRSVPVAAAVQPQRAQDGAQSRWFAAA